MAINQKSRWDDVGSEPPAGEAKYTAGEQPIAEYDNWFNYSVTQDIANLNAWLDNLGITKVYFDSEANMPASGETTELFIATDTNKIYRGTGDGWQLLKAEPDSHTHSPSEIIPQGEGSGLNADMLDGYHASDFSTWTEIKNNLATEGAKNVQYDADLDGVVDYAKDADTVDGKHASDFALAAQYVDKSDVSPRDSLNPVQNDTGRPIVVFYSAKMTVNPAVNSSTPSVGYIRIFARVNGSNRARTTAYYENKDISNSVDIGAELVFVVLPGESYYIGGEWGGVNAGTITDESHYWLVF